MADPRNNDMEALLNQDLDNLFQDHAPNEEEASVQSNNSTAEVQDDDSALGRDDSNPEDSSVTEDQGEQHTPPPKILHTQRRNCSCALQRLSSRS